MYIKNQKLSDVLFERGSKDKFKSFYNNAIMPNKLIKHNQDTVIVIKPKLKSRR
jgi:hypothetical protein